MAARADPPKLSLVSDEIYQLDRKPENTAQRVRRLQVEARILAREQIEALERDMLRLADLAREVADGGDAYPVGVRELFSRMAEDLQSRVLTCQALMERTPEPRL